MQATEPMSIEQAAESLLEVVVSDQEDDTTEAETDEAPQDETEAEEAEETAEDEDDADEAESEDDADEDETEEDEDADQEDQPETFLVKVDGKDVAVSLEDLKRSYSGQAYIQEGMKKAAETRKQAEEAYSQLQANLNQVLTFAQQLQQEGMTPPKPPSEDLLRTDPLAYMEAEAKFRRDNDAFQKKQGELQQLQQQNQQVQQRAMQAYVSEQAEIAKQLIPELADPQKAKAIHGQILATAKEAYGLSDEEIGGIMDARYVKILDDARRWRELQSSKKAVAAKAKKAKPVVKPSAKKAKSSNQVEREKARQRLKQTGSVDDAVSLIFNPDV